MPTYATDGVKAALAEFFRDGNGPTHSDLSSALHGAGLSDNYQTPTSGTFGQSKHQRVLAAFDRCSSNSEVAEKLVKELLRILYGTQSQQSNLSNLQTALRASSWELDSDWQLQPFELVVLNTGGRRALNDLLARLQRNAEDSASNLGAAKELMESTAKYILRENNNPPDRSISFPRLIALAFDELGLNPATIDAATDTGQVLREIYQTAKTLALKINDLRNLQGTGHGRTHSTEIPLEVARFVVREAVHISELMLSTHDRQTRDSFC